MKQYAIHLLFNFISLCILAQSSAQEAAKTRTPELPALEGRPEFALIRFTDDKTESGMWAILDIPQSEKRLPILYLDKNQDLLIDLQSEKFTVSSDPNDSILKIDAGDILIPGRSKKHTDLQFAVPNFRSTSISGVAFRVNWNNELNIFCGMGVTRNAKWSQDLQNPTIFSPSPKNRLVIQPQVNDSSKLELSVSEDVIVRLKLGTGISESSAINAFSNKFLDIPNEYFELTLTAKSEDGSAITKIFRMDGYC